MVVFRYTTIFPGIWCRITDTIQIRKVVYVHHESTLRRRTKLSRYSPYEKKIWQRGFFQGINITKQKYSVSHIEPEFEKIKGIVISYIQEEYFKCLSALKKAKCRKLHFRRRSIERYNKDITAYKTCLQFFVFCESVGIDAFLCYLKDSSYFEQILFDKENENEFDG